ncbi:ROK family protein [Thioclava atlantica]|uniref:ROK family transcriptional regulator n=1 Tax=Thioclava atlantica TaxID=1317124 RepID=A0A085U0E4_9RHOB|nr:ROK family protein [Thioclava atlantica]KFE36441.1 ROK family transcriptional regulator [Thioclava atlantica]
MFGTSSGAAGVHNRRVVIDAIRVNGALSRAALARATKLAKQTLSNIIDDLEREGLVIAREVVKEGRGKPAMPYDLAPFGAFSIGLQIDRHLAHCVVVDFLGRVVLRRETSLAVRDPETGFRTLCTLIGESLEELARLHPKGDERVLGLGVAMPGPFGLRGANMTDDDYTMARWQEYPLIANLEKETGLEASLQNDAGAAATAEKLTGRAHGLRSAACIYLGYGLGAGLIINGELFSGRDGNAGEIGMIPSPFAKRRGTTLEQNVSLNALCDAFALDRKDMRLFARIEDLLANGGEQVEDWIVSAANHLDWAADLLQLTLSPEGVILCGTAPPALIERLVAHVNARRKPAGKQGLLSGKADPWIVAIGAAAEPISRSFDPRYSALLKN